MLMDIKQRLTIFRMWYRGVVRVFPTRNESKDHRAEARALVKHARRARDYIYQGDK